MGITGLLREQLPSSGQKLAESKGLKATKKKKKRHPTYLGIQWGRG